MPSSSAKQHRFMEAVAHNPKFAKKAGVPQSVGQDFVDADGTESNVVKKKHDVRHPTTGRYIKAKSSRPVGSGTPGSIATQ